MENEMNTENNYQTNPIGNSNNFSNGNAPIQFPDSNLVWAIVSTILCCMPLGIVGIVYAVLTENYIKSNKLDDANRCAQSAAKWIKITVIVGLIIYVLYIIFYALIFKSMFSAFAGR